MLGGADNPNGELPSYITGADKFQCLALPVWLMADHCRMSLSHFSFPEVFGCAASLLS